MNFRLFAINCLEQTTLTTQKHWLHLPPVHAHTMDLLSDLRKNPSCLSLMYRIPSFSNLVEGCMARVTSSCLLNLIVCVFPKTSKKYMFLVHQKWWFYCNYAVKKGTGYCYKVQLHNWLMKTMQMSVTVKTPLGSSTFF